MADRIAPPLTETERSARAYGRPAARASAAVRSLPLLGNCGCGPGCGCGCQSGGPCHCGGNCG